MKDNDQSYTAQSRESGWLQRNVPLKVFMFKVDFRPVVARQTVVGTSPIDYSR